MSLSDTVKFEYDRACTVPSDINYHLPKLNELARSVNHVTEFGVRTGESTRAFLYSDVVLRSYDLYKDPYVEKMFNDCAMSGKDVRFIQGNSLSIDIEETDLLFIDTDHSYNQLKAELDRHNDKVRKYLVFHDTQTYGCNPNQNNAGLIPAIMELLCHDKRWSVNYFTTINNGLTVLEKALINY